MMWKLNGEDNNMVILYKGYPAGARRFLIKIE